LKCWETADGVIVELYVKPNSREFRIQSEDSGIVVFCRAAPVKGKVNKELIKEFTRLFGKNVAIVSGSTSRQKRLLIRDVSAREVVHSLSGHV
jgi:uncharacterized protein (TIGR00251 family)